MDYKLIDFAPPETPIDDILTLPYEARQKSRLPATTDKGVEVGVFLTRGAVLRSGMVLTDSDTFNVLIKAAAEPVSVMRCDDPLQFSRACYHLGNRHVALQIIAGELRYLSDHVLDHMLEGLGLKVSQQMLPFEPEVGAYHNKHEH